MNKSKLNILLLFVALIFCGMISSCSDDPILDSIAPDGSINVDSEGGGLEFIVGATRGFEKDHFYELSTNDEEIVINPDNFHVVLFNEKGQVLQIWANQELTEFEEFDTQMGLKRTKYKVKIPRQDITPEVLEHIRNNNFKIAVFANWDGYPDFTTYTSYDSQNRIDHNSIYYISHCRKDGSYDSGTVDGQLNDADVFGFITGGGSKMGISQEWVSERYKNDQEAEAAIRSSYNVKDSVFHSTAKPILTNDFGIGTVFEDMKDYDYYNVWEIWNFGAEKNYNGLFYITSNGDIRSAWMEKNKDCWDKFGSKVEGTTTKDEGFNGPITVRNLTVEGNSWNVSNYHYIGRGYGVKLSNSNRGTNVGTIDVANGSYIDIKIPADGYVNIKCSSYNGGGGYLVARRGKLNSTSNIHQSATYVSDADIQTVNLRWAKDDNEQELVRITGEPEDLVLYATGGDVIIYEIEYIKSRTIQTVDRQMINPASTPEGGISMYGIQDFDKVPSTIWPDGTTFNLSRYETTQTESSEDAYNYRTISLLRSVAKVEVLVPTSLFPEPSHMYMRTINRFSRSAPIDVFLPTNLIWDGWDKDNPLNYPETVRDGGHYFRDYVYGTTYVHNYKNGVNGVDAEYENLRKYGFTYEDGNTSVPSYRNAVAWIFGIWASEYGWNWNNYNITIKNSEFPYPRVFNTRISRSDYAHMIDGGKKIVDGKEYYYYYAYLPEKNVTDPNDKGTLDADPKVMRIEMRFGDRNTDNNLDDNASYRIYFTPGGKGMGIDNRDAYDGNMEKGNNNNNSIPMQNLHNIYPVIRNHLYRFKITGIEMNELQVNFEAQGPDSRDVNIEFN